MAILLIATKAYCNSLKPEAFPGDITMCPTRSEIESAGLHIKKGNEYATNQLVPRDHIERIDWVYTFSVSPTSTSISAGGGSKKFTVTSYKEQYSTSSTGSNILIEGTRVQVPYTSKNAGSGKWDSNNNTITYGANPDGTISSGTITWTQAESNKQATATHTQGGDFIKEYQIPVVRLSYNTNVSASGIPAIMPVVEYEQTAVWESGKTTKITSGGVLNYRVVEGSIILDQLNGGVSANSKGTTPSGITEIGKVELSVTLNEKTGKSNHEVVRQEANTSKDKWGVWSVSCSAVPMVVDASGGVVNLSGKATRSGKKSWTSGSVEDINATENVTSFSIRGVAVGFDIKGSVINVAPNQSGGDRTAVVYSTHDGVNSEDILITQSGDKIKSWGEVTLKVISESPLVIPASGGFVTVQATATQAYTTMSGKTGSQSINVTYEPDQKVSANSKGTNRSGVTKIGEVVVKAIGNNDISAAPQTVIINQAANNYVDENHQSWLPIPTITAVPTTMPGMGGTIKITWTPSVSRFFDRRWDSGSIQTLTQISNGSASITTNPDNEFSLDKNQLTAPANNSGDERSAIITATYPDADISKTLTVKQPVGTLYKTEKVKVYKFSVTPDSLNFENAGGSKLLTIISYYVEWSREGSSNDGGLNWNWGEWTSSEIKVKVKPRASKTSDANNAFTLGEMTDSTGDNYTISVSAQRNRKLAQISEVIYLEQDQTDIYILGDKPNLVSSNKKIDVTTTQEGGVISMRVPMDYLGGQNDLYLSSDTEFNIHYPVFNMEMSDGAGGRTEVYYGSLIGSSGFKVGKGSRQSLRQIYTKSGFSADMYINKTVGTITITENTTIRLSCEFYINSSNPPCVCKMDSTLENALLNDFYFVVTPGFKKYKCTKKGSIRRYNGGSGNGGYIIELSFNSTEEVFRDPDSYESISMIDALGKSSGGEYYDSIEKVGWDYYGSNYDLLLMKG